MPLCQICFEPIVPLKPPRMVNEDGESNMVSTSGEYFNPSIYAEDEDGHICHKQCIEDAKRRKEQRSALPDIGRVDWARLNFSVLKPKAHVKALTYKPKIARVLSGEIRQTIRPLVVVPTVGNGPLYVKGMVAIGDTILLHGWEGKPYRSRWSWRQQVVVSDVVPIAMFNEGIAHLHRPGLGIGMFLQPVLMKWNECDELARADGFNDGIEMGAYFNPHYDLKPWESQSPSYFQIIRWNMWACWECGQPNHPDRHYPECSKYHVRGACN